MEFKRKKKNKRGLIQCKDTDTDSSDDAVPMVPGTNIGMKYGSAYRTVRIPCIFI